MNNMNYSEDKINDLNVNLWITANAGSGKTTRLVERFLFLLENGIKPEEIVCITYTEIGSAEMINRIIFEANKRNINVDENKLRISTIHSFCRSILIANGWLYEDIGILDNNNEFVIDEMVRRIVSSFSKNITELKDSEIQFINELIKEKNISSFYEMVKAIIGKQLYFFSLFDKISIKKSQNNDDVLKNVDIDKMYQLLPKDLQHFLTEKNNIDKEKTLLESELKKMDLNFLYACCSGRKGIDKNYLSELDLRKLEAWENIILKSDKTLRSKKNPNEFEKRIQNYFVNLNIQNGVNFTYSVLNIAYDVLKKYQDFKNNMNVCTYDDFLFQTFELLTKDCLFKNKDICKNGSNIKHLMLDEAQDTNPISWEIIKKIVEKTKCNFFIIGDEKQSIYRFQGAKVEEYEKNKIEFSRLSERLNIPFNCSIKLNVSYRSIQPILDEADELCRNNSGIFNNVKHICSVNELKKKPNGYILEKKDSIFVEEIDLSSDKNDEVKNDWLSRTNSLVEKQQNKQKKIKKFAETIYKYILINKNDAKNNIFGEKDDNSIAILYYKKDDFIFDVLSELQYSYNVDVIVNNDIEKSSIYYNDILSILCFFVLQNDNMNLACLLKSEIFNFTDKMLAKLCLSSDELNFEKTLWHLMKSRIFTDKNEKDKLDYANDILDKVLNCSSISDILFLIEDITKSNKRYFSSFNFIKSCFDSYSKKTQFNDYDVRSFIFYLKGCRENFQNKKNSQKISNKKELKIFFSTVHGVKGMEFDSVFILEKKNCKNNFNSENEKMFFFNDCFWYKIAGKTNTLIDGKIEEQRQQECNEKLRLKYVAITRAKRKIVYFNIKKD